MLSLVLVLTDVYGAWLVTYGIVMWNISLGQDIMFIA